MEHPARPVLRFARAALLVALFGGAAAGTLAAQCPPGEAPVAENYTGLTVEEVEARLRADGDFYVGVDDQGNIRSPVGSEWTRVVAANSAGCQSGTCLTLGEFVGVVLKPVDIADADPYLIGKEEPRDAPRERSMRTGFFVLGALILGLVVGFLIGRQQRGRAGA